MLQYLHPFFLFCLCLTVHLNHPAQAGFHCKNNLKADQQRDRKPAADLIPLLQHAQTSGHSAVGVFVAPVQAVPSCRRVKRTIDTVLDVDRAEQAAAISGNACAPNVRLWCS